MNDVLNSISFTVVRRDELSPSLADEMFQLLTTHFDGVTRTQFESDLAEKNRVILLFRDASLVGFSTLLAYTTTFEGSPLNVIYSGDTIVSPTAWGTTALPRAWVAAVNELRADLPEHRCYWLLLTSGFRTYRFLPVFWREFFPRHDCRTPAHIAALLEHLAIERFGKQFDPDTGIVRFPQPQKLNHQLQCADEGRSQNPHIAFFNKRNPDSVHGNELVCLTEICEANLTRAGQRMTRTQCSESGINHC
jgi:hypothetical protein